MYTDTARANALIKKHSMKIKEVYAVPKIRSYYAFNLKMPDSIVKKWQDAIDGLRKDGTALNILKKFNLGALYPE